MNEDSYCVHGVNKDKTIDSRWSAEAGLDSQRCVISLSRAYNLFIAHLFL